MCRHIYYWNIVDCDVKQQIHLTSPVISKTQGGKKKIKQLLILRKVVPTRVTEQIYDPVEERTDPRV